jgi:hypothetical protein
MHDDWPWFYWLTDSKTLRRICKACGRPEKLYESDGRWRAYDTGSGVPSCPACCPPPAPVVPTIEEASGVVEDPSLLPDPRELSHPPAPVCGKEGEA